MFIALALINDPELVFLDELTTGLDPQARRTIWDLVRRIRARGKTVFMTTHLMEEADRLCDRVAIIDHGRIVDVGAPADLVRRHCPERTVILSAADPSAVDRFRAMPAVESTSAAGSQLTIRGRGEDLVTDVIRCIAEHRIHVADFRTELPTLEDVFIKLTARVVPLTYSVSLLCGIWHGDGWIAHAGDVAILALLFAAFTALSARVFRWE